MADRCIQGGRRNRIRLSAPEFVRAALRLAVGFALGWPAIGRAMEPLQAPDVRPWSAAVRAAPDDRRARLQLCEALRRLGRIEARREAAEQYRLALKNWPRDPDLLTAFGQLRVEQGFLSQGAALFRRALKSDPARVDAEFGLARLALRDYLRFVEARPLAESRRRLERVLALRPDHRDALYFRALVLFEAGRPDSALEAARALTARWPEDPWGDLVLGAFAVANARPYEAAEALAAGLARLPEGERAPFESLLFLDRLAAEHSEDLAEPERPKYADAFWRVNDPTPASPLNERLLEHRRRVVMAELLFGISEKRIRGWNTAPGEALIRFGMPEARQYSMGAPFPTLSTTHTIKGRKVVFDFVDANLSGQWLQPFNGGMPTSMDIEMNRAQSVGPDLWPGPGLDTRINVTQFRNVNGDTRLELNVAARQNGAAPETVARDAAVYDTAWSYEGRDTNHFGEAGRVLDRQSGRVDLVDVIPFTARGDSVWIGASIEAPRSQSGERWLRKIGVRRFSDTELCLSDLLLLDQAVFAPAVGRFARRDGTAVPNPRRFYRSGESIPVYFEAYNLAPAADGSHPYTLLLQVEDAAPPHPRMSRPALVDLKPAAGPLVTARFDEVSAPGRLERLLDVAVGVLPAGHYRLRVIVEQAAGARRAVATTTFRVVEPAASVARDASGSAAGR